MYYGNRSTNVAMGGIGIVALFGWTCARHLLLVIVVTVGYLILHRNDAQEAPPTAADALADYRSRVKQEERDRAFYGDPLSKKQEEYNRTHDINGVLRRHQ